MTEPILDLSEILDLYKADARANVEGMRRALGLWEEIQKGGESRRTLRSLSHQLRGSGRTYGFREVTRLGKAIETIVRRIESGHLTPDDRVRHAIESKVERLAEIFSK